MESHPSHLSLPSWTAILGAAVAAGIGVETFGVLWDTAMQQQIPGEMLSRLYSYDMLGSLALMPVGYAVAGPVAELFGVRTTLWSAAAITVAATLPVLLVRDVRTLERKAVEGDTAAPLSTRSEIA
jgi:MFS family permease